MLARKLAVLTTAVVAGIALTSPARAAGATVDFGQKVLGESETKTVTVALQTTPGALGSAIDGHTFPPLTLEGGVSLTSDEVKALVKDAVESLNGGTKFSILIVQLDQTGDEADFTVGTGCNDKTGTSDETCSFDATFKPTAEGARQLTVKADFGWSGGKAELTEALAGVATDAAVKAAAAQIVTGLNSDIVEILGAVINPVAELKGVGAAPGSGGGSGETPTPPANTGGSGGGNHLPQTGVKVAQLAGGGLLLVLVGAGVVFLARRRQETAA